MVSNPKQFKEEATFAKSLIHWPYVKLVCLPDFCISSEDVSGQTLQADEGLLVLQPLFQADANRQFPLQSTYIVHVSLRQVNDVRISNDFLCMLSHN